jgi:hypothetical protein
LSHLSNITTDEHSQISKSPDRLAEIQKKVHVCHDFCVLNPPGRMSYFFLELLCASVVILCVCLSVMRVYYKHTMSLSVCVCCCWTTRRRRRRRRGRLLNGTGLLLIFSLIILFKETTLLLSADLTSYQPRLPVYYCKRARVEEQLKAGSRIVSSSRAAGFSSAS